jgi:GTP-binding protein HflX
MLKAILIDIIPPTMPADEADYRMLEAENLIKTYGGIILIKKIQKKVVPNYKTFVGGGKAAELMEEGKEQGANILIVNNELKPNQTYNLSELFRPANIQVWDRIDLILKIFQKHATTNEARLEIELASIRHMGPRIFGMGMQLSRQGGGIGTKGVGETNIELMHRHLGKMEDRIESEIEACKKVRKLHREGRRRRDLKTVGIIGYTNAGKSSLLNALTKKGAYVADQLFATLDTRVGKMYLPPAPPAPVTPSRSKKNSADDNTDQGFAWSKPQEVLISDTIGFIQNLPPLLIKSFQSTLEETIEADLLLHVIDINDPKLLHKIDVVNDILVQIGADKKHCIYVFNKTDLLSKKALASLSKKLKTKFKKLSPCFVSSTNREGLDDLKAKIAANL